MRAMTCCFVRRTIAVALWIIVACSLALLAQTPESNPGMRVTRFLSAAHALPESTFQVTLELKADTDLNGVGLQESLPVGWLIHPVDNAGAAFKRSEGEWVFNEPIEAGATATITYEVTVPAAGRLMSDPLPQCFTITGTYQTTVPSYETATEGESTIEIVSALPVGTAIAHLIPQQIASADIIDLRLSRWISEAQLQRALELWQQDLPVPGTAGERIDLAMINHLAAQFETCTRADDALPLSIDPELIAVRTLDTFLPCDSVLLPEGCLDPGQSARLITVRIEITPSFDAYGVGLKEWFPPSWKATPIEQDGFWYRPSASEWVYPTRVRAGTTLEVVYQIEVIPTPFDSIQAGAECCGQEMTIVGEASSALECSVAPVLGEDTITVGTCIPVMLAISRWDVEEDRLDVRLSDTITFRQVQRAVQFWAENLPVPHTCGYTVGYHTLKNIVAYWLSGTPITMPLSQAGVLSACGDSSEDCETAACIDGWICQLAEMQDPADFVGLPAPPTVVVDGGPDRVLTCAQPSVTLSAVTTGGVAPFIFEWRDSQAQIIGTAQNLSVNTAGAYTLIATSCGGCLAIDTVTVTEDFAKPSVLASVSGVLTAYVQTVSLRALVISGSPGTLAIIWTTPSGEIIHDALSPSVSKPGVYSITAKGANGCSGSAEVTVLQDIEPPSVQIEVIPTLLVDAAPTGAVLTCALPEIALEGQVSGGREPYILQWTNGQGDSLGEAATLGVDAPGVYLLTATGANGASGSTSVEVGQDIEPPTIAISASGELTCSVTEIAVSTTVTGGRAPFAYQWTNATGEIVGSSSPLTVTEPGAYAVTITGSNGCSGLASIVVEQNIAPPVVSTVVGGVLTCSVSEVEVSAVASGGRAPYAFTWANAAGQVLGDTTDLRVSAPGSYAVTVIGDNGCSTQATVVVEQDIAAPVVAASVDGILTCAVSTVGLHANVVGGRTPLAFEWTNEAGQIVGTSVGLTTSAPGIYTILVTGANGCTSTDRVIVAEDVAVPSLSITVDEPLTCAVTEVQVSATVSGGRSPYTYQWTAPGGSITGQSSTLIASAPGTYTLTVTGANGCQSIASIEVQQDIEPPAIAIPAPELLTCAVTEVAVSATVTGGRAPYSYTWTNAANHAVGQSDSVVVSTPGLYSVTVAGANGCQSTARIEVQQDTESPVVAIPAPEELTCAITEVTLTATTAGGRTPYSYTWMNEAGQVLGSELELVVNEPGAYSVTVTGANGCEASACMTVQQDIEPPVVTIPVPENLTCSVTSVMLSPCVSAGSAPYVYTWINAAGQILGSASQLNVAEPGIYTLTVTGANGCASSASATVQQDIAPPCIALCANQTMTCAEPTVFVNAEICGGRAPFSYQWTDDCGTVIATTEDVSIGFAGIYTLTVTGANGCSSSRSIEIVDGINPPTVDAGSDQALVCVGDEVVLDATVTGGTGPYTYIWVDSCGEIVGNCEDLLVTLPGIYILTVQSADGCVGMDSVTVELP